MVFVKIKDWVPISGVTHTATRWQLCKDNTFATPSIDITSQDYLTFLVADMDIPVGVVYYVRAQRQFNDESANYWSEVITVTNTDAVNSSLIPIEDIAIEKPIIYITADDLKEENETFTVRTSKIRGNDGHIATHWFIYDGDDNLLYFKLYDTVNKESIVIPNNYMYRNKTRLVFKAIHCTSSGVESPVGSYTLELDNYNYEITSAVDQITPYLDYTLTYAAVDSDYPMGIKKIEIKDSNDETILYEKVVSETDKSIVVPWYIMSSGQTLIAAIYAINKNAELSVSKRVLYVQRGNVLDIQDVNHQYVKTYTDDTNLMNAMLIPNGACVFETANNVVPIPIVGSNQLHGLKMNTDKTYSNIGALTGITLMSDSNENLYARYLENRIFLIDTLNATGTPSFMVYRHTLKDDIYTLLGVVSRDDEVYPVGKNNAIVQISGTEFLYVPFGTASLKKLDISSLTVSNVNTVPLTDAGNVILVPMHNDKILCIGGSGFTNYVYNVSDGTFVEGVTTTPGTFINRALKVCNLVNGDSLIYKTDHIADDNNVAALYFNHITMLFEELTHSMDDEVVPTSHISLRAGDVLFYRYNNSIYSNVNTKITVESVFN